MHCTIQFQPVYVCVPICSFFLFSLVQWRMALYMQCFSMCRKWSILLRTQRKGWGEEESEGCQGEREEGVIKSSIIRRACLYLHQKTLSQEREMGYPCMDRSLPCSRIVSHNVHCVQCMSSTCDAHVMLVCIMHAHCRPLLFLWSVVILAVAHLIIQLCIMYCVHEA